MDQPLRTYTVTYSPRHGAPESIGEFDREYLAEDAIAEDIAKRTSDKIMEKTPLCRPCQSSGFSTCGFQRAKILFGGALAH